MLFWGKEWIPLFLLFAFLSSALINIILMVVNGFKIFIMSKSTSLTNHSTFESEKERFWDYLQLFLIMLVTWPLEISTEFMPSDPLKCKIVLELVKAFSAVLIAVIFLCKRIVRNLVFDRYGILTSI
jgi:uncharacterized membrane-anchored protein